MNNAARTAHSSQPQSYPLISVIVPVYNVEKYLDRCVKSIVNQTYRNLEIILVDDGSPDNCPAMCDEWSLRDERIRVIHKENGGLSSARNAGLDIAKGQYIGFVDSDDLIMPEMYDKLCKLVTDNDADMSICDFKLLDEQGNNILNTGPLLSTEVLLHDQPLSKVVMPGNTWHYVVVWNKLYKSELFKSLRFPEGFVREDEFIAHHVFGSCKKVVVSNDQLYVYIRRNDSIMGNIRANTYIMKNVNGLMYAMMDRRNYLLSIGRPDFAEFVKRGFYHGMRYAMEKVNYMQYRKELSGYMHYTLKKLFLSNNMGNILRGVKLALLWFRSLFRPYINKEKEQ